MPGFFFNLSSGDQIQALVLHGMLYALWTETSYLLTQEAGFKTLDFFDSSMLLLYASFQL